MNIRKSVAGAALVLAAAALAITVGEATAVSTGDSGISVSMHSNDGAGGSTRP